MYIEVQNATFHFCVAGEMIKRVYIESLSTNHDETDTQICLHALSNNEIPGIKDNIFRASDIDIAIIMVHRAQKNQGKPLDEH